MEVVYLLHNNGKRFRDSGFRTLLDSGTRMYLSTSKITKLFSYLKSATVSDSFAVGVDGEEAAQQDVAGLVDIEGSPGAVEHDYPCHEE